MTPLSDKELTYLTLESTPIGIPARAAAEIQALRRELAEAKGQLKQLAEKSNQCTGCGVKWPDFVMYADTGECCFCRVAVTERKAELLHRELAAWKAAVDNYQNEYPELLACDFIRRDAERLSTEPLPTSTP